MSAEVEAASVIARRDWLALATIGDGGSPVSSYVPFTLHDAAFAIAVSRLSAHTAHLAARPGASVLVVGQSPDGGDTFARARLSIDVEAQFVSREMPDSARIWDDLENRFGQIVRTLRELSDFETVLLFPVRARIVLGFAAASDLDATALRRALRTAAGA